MIYEKCEDISPDQYELVFNIAERISATAVALADFDRNMMLIARELRYLTKFLRLCDSLDDMRRACKYFEFAELCDVLREDEDDQGLAA